MCACEAFVAGGPYTYGVGKAINLLKLRFPKYCKEEIIYF